MMPTTWHKIASVEPANGARCWVRNGTMGRPAQWDASRCEWYLITDSEDWRASAACYPEWRLQTGE